MPLQTHHTLLTQREAAERLGVSQPNIARLLRDGTLDSIDGDDDRHRFVTMESVRRYAQQRCGRGRPLSATTAMGLLLTLDGIDAPWLTPVQRGRITRRLKTTTANELAWLVRRRATIRRYWCRPSRLGTVRERTAAGGSADRAMAALFGLHPAQSAECYVAESQLAILEQCARLRDAEPRTLTLRILPDALAPTAPPGGTMPTAICAADLTESIDPREHTAGLAKLDELLREWRDTR